MVLAQQDDCVLSSEACLLSCNKPDVARALGRIAYKRFYHCQQHFHHPAHHNHASTVNGQQRRRYDGLIVAVMLQWHADPDIQRLGRLVLQCGMDAPPPPPTTTTRRCSSSYHSSTYHHPAALLHPFIEAARVAGPRGAVMWALANHYNCERIQRLGKCALQRWDMSERIGGLLDKCDDFVTGKEARWVLVGLVMAEWFLGRLQSIQTRVCRLY